MLDYLQERAEEPCGRTIPEAMLATLVFFEKVGCVRSADRLRAAPILRNMVNQATHDLEVGAPPTSKAPLLPVMLLGSLELPVIDEAASLFARGVAFTSF